MPALARARKVEVSFAGDPRAGQSRRVSLVCARVQTRRCSIHVLGPVLAAVSLSLSLACNNDDDGSTSEASLTGSSTGSAPGTTGSDASTGSTGAAPTTGADASTGEASTGEASTATTTGATAETGEATTAEGTTSAEATTEPAPTDGPGVLPGEDGMDAFCRRYVECGGTYYAGEQECLDATYDYWGMCPTRKAALDEFGACMSEMACTDWSPDAYNPGSTPCASQWDQVGASEACG